MMELTDRQKDILESIVSEYIDTAYPVSSQILEQEYDFGVSPATLRNEMLALSEQGFLHKPYASSGRVPTDMGYRFFVDQAMQKEKRETEQFQELFTQNMQDALEFAALSIKSLAAASSALAAIYVGNKEIVWKDGWEELLEEPEFKETESIRSFTSFLNDFEEYAGNLNPEDRVQIFIGRENPFSKENEFSIMLAECNMPQGKGLVALLGPKRMAYPKNIGALDAFVEVWKKNQ